MWTGWPADAKGLEDRYYGVCYVPRAYLMRGAVTTRGLSAGSKLQPAARSALRYSELKHGRETRRGVPVFRSQGFLAMRARQCKLKLLVESASRNWPR